jgi:hypothetical protein
MRYCLPWSANRGILSRRTIQEHKEKEGEHSRLNPQDIYRVLLLSSVHMKRADRAQMLDLRLDHLMEMANILVSYGLRMYTAGADRSQRAVDSLRPDEPTTPDEDYRWSQVRPRSSPTLRCY